MIIIDVEIVSCFGTITNFGNLNDGGFVTKYFVGVSVGIVDIGSCDKAPLNINVIIKEIMIESKTYIRLYC